MNDLRQRFKTLDRMPAPDLWPDVTERVALQRGIRDGTSPILTRIAPFVLAATAIAAVLVIGAMLVLPRFVDVGTESERPSPSETAASVPDPTTLGEGFIAYASKTGLSTTYIVPPGGEPELIAPSDLVGNEVRCPAFSPDGKRLAVGMPGGTILVLSMDEQGLTGAGDRLASSASESPHCAAWAPDSSAIAFSDGSAIVIETLDGQTRRIDGWDTGGDATFGVSYPADGAVEWSPDGSGIAVARASGTWLLPVDGSAPARLDDTPAFSVSWSPDSTRLVVGAEGPKALVIATADGATVADLPLGFSRPVWSPADDRIAMSDEVAALIVVRPDGSDLRIIDGYGYNATWSPDGQRLMYIQDASSTSWRLMVANGDGSGAPATLVGEVTIPNAHSFPAAEQFSWQPVP